MPAQCKLRRQEDREISHCSAGAHCRETDIYVNSTMIVMQCHEQGNRDNEQHSVCPQGIREGRKEDVIFDLGFEG